MAALTCYTTALHGYLELEWDADPVIARSIRLAIEVGRADGLVAFSHHEPSLARLPDGSTLRYAAGGDACDALAGVAEEVRRFGRAVVVVDSARLPWFTGDRAESVPHWLLVVGHDRDGWSVVDRFTALLPRGPQQPYAGRMTTTQLAEAMQRSRAWTPRHRLRNAMAFGAAERIPEGRAWWLRRTSAPEVNETTTDVGRWLADKAGVLGFLRDFLDTPERIAEIHDDLWAASRHHAFAYRWRLTDPARTGGGDCLRRAIDCWEALPRALRFASEAAQRGRARPAIVGAALGAILDAEEQLSWLE